MSSKREFSLGFVSALPRAEVRRPTVIENTTPTSLGGQRIRQLDLPREYLESALKKRTTGVRVAPSNLAEVRARLKKEPKVG